MSGSSTSSTTTSGRVSSIRARACCPVAASSTLNPACRRWRDTSYRLASVSSTTRTRPAPLRLSSAMGPSAPTGHTGLDRRLVDSRHGELEARACPGLALQLDAAPQQGGQLARQREAQAGAGDPLLQRVIHLLELLEDPLLVLRRDADAGVAHRQDH